MLNNILQTDSIKNDHRSILKIMGYSDPDSSPARIHNLINEFMSKAPLWINPSYHYVIKKVEVVSGRYALLEGGIRLESAVIAELLKRCDKAAFFALTIGSRLEKISASFAANGAVLKAAVLDAVGSVLVEELAETVQSRIATRALMQGLAISRRFSPGYCDWHVNQQPMVFKSLGENNTGIKLNRSNLMTPQKSISGIIGLGPFGLADKYTPCRTCLKNRHCPWRRF